MENLEDHEKNLPEIIIARVKEEAKVFSSNHISKFNFRPSIYEQCYYEAVLPYASRIHVLEELVEQMQHQYNELAESAKELSDACKQTLRDNKEIKKICKELKEDLNGKLNA